MKKSIEKILVPIHYSEPSFHAAWTALALARSTHAEMTLMHIHIRERALREVMSIEPEDLADLSDNKFQDIIMKMVGDPSYQELRSAVNHSTVEFNELSTKFSPSEEICQYARDHDIDLIVMGYGSFAGFRELLFGSVSHEVIHKASCPVTVVH